MDAKVTVRAKPTGAELHAAFKRYEKMSPFEIKDKLLSLAKESSAASAATLLNAGRGNPNWIATTPREAFFLLGQFAIAESKRVMDRPDLAGMPDAKGIAARLKAFLADNAKVGGASMLREMVPFAVKKFGFNADAFVHELVDSIIGDNYPVPPRMLVHAERVANEYLMWAMCDDKPPAGKFDVFATEGGTAAMCYTFKSLMLNRILHKGDKIALGAPIFTPYLEFPHLAEFDFETVFLYARQEDGFQYSDADLKKLEDPAIKAFFVVNPGNPTSAAISPAVHHKLVKLVKTKRPDLIVLTDDVYGTFVPGFRSLMADLPHNTIGVYSYSKYFGCTGWRLGTIALHEDNIIDDMIQAHPRKVTDELNKRYSPLTLEPHKMKFIDRLVADSRDIALNHTAGLSLPQQAQMTLFSLFQLLDKDMSYRDECLDICKTRVAATVKGLGIDVTTGTSPLFASYYGLIDFEFWARKYLGDEVVEFVKANVHPLDIVYRLASEHSVVLLNGNGFEAPDYTVRISFANLPDDVYEDLGRLVRAVAKVYSDAYRQAKGTGNGKKPTPAKASAKTKVHS